MPLHKVLLAYIFFSSCDHGEERTAHPSLNSFEGRKMGNKILS